METKWIIGPIFDTKYSVVSGGQFTVSGLAVTAKLIMMPCSPVVKKQTLYLPLSMLESCCSVRIFESLLSMIRGSRAQMSATVAENNLSSEKRERKHLFHSVIDAIICLDCLHVAHFFTHQLFWLYISI